MLEAALLYARIGWRVFPCRPRLKTPQTQHGCKDATTDEATIREWWAKWPTANIGLACGPESGVFVIDIDMDADKGIDGFESLAQFPDLPDTVMQDTPRGGRHYLFRADTPPANKNNFRTGIDIRSTGYYVLLAPSIHPNGGKYKWAKGHNPIDCALADYPDALRPELEKPKVAPPQKHTAPPPEAPPNVIERATRYLSKMPPAIQGHGGHDALLTAARVLVTGFNLPEADALSLLWSEYNPRCSPPWNEGDPQERRDFERKVSEARTLPSSKTQGWLLGDTTSPTQRPGLRPNPNAHMEPQKPATVTDAPPASNDPLEIAKAANKTPFRNFVFEKEPPDPEKPDAPRKDIRKPRFLRDIRRDAYKRFCDFPRVLGGTLFDQDHNTAGIHEMRTTAALFTWMQEKANNKIEWWAGVGYVTKEEFFESLLCPHDGQKCYDVVSQVPDWPLRGDVFYHHPPLPPPSPNHAAFWAYIDRFLFTTCEDRHLYASCVLDSLRFDPGGKPLFVFVSPDGMGSGKSQGAEQLAYLLGSQITKTTPREITERQDDLLKRILSTSGRKNRIVLLDNITGKIRSDELASLITAHSFSGRPAYARGEESRKNDLLFILTSNGAVLNSDLAVRSVFVSFRKPESTGRWKEETRAWSDANRLQVFADAIALFKSHRVHRSYTPTTRFAGWESTSLWAACQGSADLHDAALYLSNERSGDSNDDVDLSETVEEAIDAAFRENSPEVYAYYQGHQRVFIQSNVLSDWLEKRLAKVFPKGGQTIIAGIRDLVKAGHLQNIENHDSKGWRLRSGSVNKRGLILNLPDPALVRPSSQRPDTIGLPAYAIVYDETGLDLIKM